LFTVSKPSAITSRVSKILDSFQNKTVTVKRQKSETNTSYGMKTTIPGRIAARNTVHNVYGGKPGIRTNYSS